MIHETATVDAGASIGEGTRVWHYVHVSAGARIGRDCVLGQNVYIGPRAVVGDRVRIQNNVSVYEGVELEDDVFCGPSCVFTNVRNPRAAVSKHGRFDHTVVRRGATIGANATVVCGGDIGRHAFIGAGAVVTVGTVPDYALMLGVPARQLGWVGRHGERLPPSLICPVSGLRYVESAGVLRCLDLDECAPLL